MKLCVMVCLVAALVTEHTDAKTVAGSSHALVAAEREHHAVVASETKFANMWSTLRATTAADLKKVVKTIREDEAGEASGGSFVSRVVVQLIFGIVYYFVVMKNYPKLEEDAEIPKDRKEQVEALQNKNAVLATTDVSITNLLLAWCCSGPRAAHTFDKVDVLSYWPGLFLMTFFPCCTLFWANSITDLNVKLGGEKQELVMACIMSFFCSCCLIAQDAQALDIMTGHDTKLIGDAVATSEK